MGYSNYRKCHHFVLMGLSLLLVANAAMAASSNGATKQVTASSPLTVAVKVAPPFVIAEGKGQYGGLAVDLWEKTAHDHHWTFHYKQYDLEGLLQAVTAGKVDVGLGAITATAGRTQHMDFAHPITSSGLGVAVRKEGGSGWLAVLRAIMSPAFLSVVGVLVLLLLIVGFLVWLAEHRANPDEFGGTAPHGIFSGFWWAMVTMTTVGYGDTAPRTIPGRVLGLIWMLAALLVVSFFTAAMTSALTVGQLTGNITSAGQLANVRVASVATSTSGKWLQNRGDKFVHVASLDEALKALAQKKVDAVVYDKPLLRWKISHHYQGSLQVLPLVLERQDYAFALPQGSPLREPINRSLLKRINSPDWNAYLAQFLGQ